jgi:hypothetical protein
MSNKLYYSNIDYTFARKATLTSTNRCAPSNAINKEYLETDHFSKTKVKKQFKLTWE